MIKKVKLYRLKIPLIKPYILSYGEIDTFDTIVCVLNIDGKEFAGAFTDLAGYFDFKIEDMWKELNNFSKGIFLKKEKIEDNILLNPFNIAIEKFFIDFKPLKVPLTKIVQGIDDISNEVKSYKVKVGMGDLKKDIDFVNSVAEKINPSSELRVDANQGFTLKEAIEFSEKVGDKILYLEQPFLVGKWEENKELIDKTKINVMIDEGISSIEDIEKAVDVGAKYIKLKLAKFKSISDMVKALEFAEAKGLKVIIGNGVATDICCSVETFVWEKGKTKMAGEMNGFLKTEVRGDILSFKENNLYLNPQGKEFIFNNLPKEIIKDSVFYG